MTLDVQRSMWTARNESLMDGRGRKVRIHQRELPVSRAEVIRLWRDDAGFRSFFIGLLVDAPFRAFRWETPPVIEANANRAFEFVLLDSPELDREADPEAFAEHFRDADRGAVLEFPNLGGDAIMVVPAPGGAQSAYAHLGAFVRHASEAQQHALWQRVGAAMQRRLGARPVWLSTAGAGVPWLHIRLDDRPKYYAYGPWREAP